MASREPVSGLRKLVSESPFAWNEYRYGHDWNCPKCGEQVFSSNYKGRLKLSQLAAETNTRGITKKAQDHLVRGCAPEPRPAERKDLDN
jgi:hypothetical protein